LASPVLYEIGGWMYGVGEVWRPRRGRGGAGDCGDIGLGPAIQLATVSRAGD